MSRTIGRAVGLTLSVFIMAAGMLGSILMSNVLAEPGAHPMAEWLTLSACVVCFAFGTMALILWVDVDAKRGEASWLS